MNGIGFKFNEILINNTAPLATAEKISTNASTKHIEVWNRHIRNLRASEVIYLEHISTLEQPAEILTKALELEIYSSNGLVKCPNINI